METTNKVDHHDVIVVGGGPAGSTVATFLQRLGHRCLVLERTSFPRYHIGESLIPNTYGTLDRLGLLGKMKASHFPEKHSVRFVSSSGRDHGEPFYFAETIQGDSARTWQVDRSEFDQMCLDNARESGVEVRLATAVERVLFEGERAVGVRVATGNGKPADFRSRVVVDASGRGTLIGSQLGLKEPVPGLKKASIWSYYRGGKRLEGIDAGETTIFRIPGGGWFWYIPLPEDIVSVGVVADPDYLFSQPASYRDVFLREVERCTALRERLAGAEWKGKVYGLGQLAYRNRRSAGDGWVMVGDAVAFLDPIYSSGLFLALSSAELAARSIHEALVEGDTSARRVGSFLPALREGVEIVRTLIHAFYDPCFSFGEFTGRFPEQRAALIDCLVGDVIGKDMDSFLDALGQMTPPPPPLGCLDLSRDLPSHEERSGGEESCGDAQLAQA